MAKKFLLVTVGGVRDVVFDKNENGEVVSLETIDGVIQMNNASVMDVIKHAIENHIDPGLETMQLDTTGIGTGLGKNLMEEVQKITNMVEASSIKELKSIIHSEMKDDHTPIAVLGNDISVNKEDEQILEELKDEGVAIYTADETDQVADDLINEATECVIVPADSAELEEPELDLGSLVGSPGKNVSEETEQKLNDDV